MVKELMHDPLFLARPSQRATKEDLNIATDLEDTLRANKETCVGMAANMIGETKCIIAFYDAFGSIIVMLNPKIVEKTLAFDTEESCLSLLGGARPTRRYKKIKVKYTDLQMRTKVKEYVGFTAQIIQHEVDHCNGVLI